VATEAGGIEPRLTAFDTTMVVVSLVIGIGIFRAPQVVATAAGSTMVFFAAWILGGIVSLIGALTFAEIGSCVPRAGGYYRVVADCYHPVLAFMLNWAQAIMQGAGAAGVAFIGAEYLVPLFSPGTPTATSVPFTALALMVALLALNFLGIRAGARTQNVLSLAKIAMILGLATAAFGPGVALAPGVPPGVAALSGSPWAALWAASIAVFYTYGGYQNTMNLGGDVRDARKNLPRAVTAGMVIVVSLYLLINLAYQRALGTAGIAGSTLVAAELARAILGPVGESVVSLAIFLSAAGFVNATILQVPRSYYAMAEDHALPAAFLRIDKRSQVQTFGLLFFGATMLLPALLLGSFEKLLNYVMFTDSLTLVVVASTVFVLRRGAVEGETRSYRMPGYPVLPALFALCLLSVSLHVLLAQTRLALAGAAIWLAGWPLLLLARRLVRPA